MAQTGYTPILIYSSSTTSNVPAAGSLTNSTLGSELAINITDGKLFYKDNANAVQVIGWKTTPTTAGGTGLTSYTAGDLLYFASGTTLSKLAIGASTTILTSSGTAPQWSAASGITVGTATNIAGGAAGSLPYQTGAGATSLLAIGTAYYQLGVNAGGTAPAWQPSATSVLTTQGDLLYASAANTLARLAKNTTATRYLSNTGTSNNPAWAQIDLTNGVTGTLPTTNGGTGLSSFSANQIFFASSTSAIGQSANLSWNGTGLGINVASASYPFDFRGGSAANVGSFSSTNTTAYSGTAYNGGIARFFISGGNGTGAANGIEFTAGGNNENFFGVVQESGGAGAFVWQGYNGSAYIERMRSHSSGGFSIGNTTDPGATNLSVTGSTTSALFKTSSGQIVPASGVTTTIFTCPSLTNGCYIVTCNISNQPPTTYSAVGLVRVGSTTLAFTSLAAAGSLTISVSGQNIQVTQNSGGTNAVDWTVTRLS